MDIFSLIITNLISPAVLFFALGVAAGLTKSDLAVPESISRYLAIYLMMSIGFKGGAALATSGAGTGSAALTLLAGLSMSIALPFLAFRILKATVKLDTPTMAAVAGQYGSISIVTFAAASAFLAQLAVKNESYILAVLALMEAPAIFSAMYLATRHGATQSVQAQAGLGKILPDLLTNGAILLLLGSFVIGWACGKPGLDKMEGFLVTPFQGILALFLLDMGLLVASQAHHVRSISAPLLGFAIYMPLIGAALGLGLSRLIGLDVGTGTLFTVLCASASYIAVPAALRVALPEAKAAVYLPLSLAVTFPFNIALGVPLYYSLAKLVLAA